MHTRSFYSAAPGRFPAGLRPVLSAMFIAAVMATVARGADGPDLSVFLQSEAPGTLYYEDEPLIFRAKEKVNAAYTVRNLYGETTGQGTMEGDRLVLPPLPCGYYDLRLDITGRASHGRRTFAVVPRRGTLPPGQESAYALVGCIALAQGWREFNKTPFAPADPTAVACALLERSGTFLSREHTGWKTLGKTGEYQLNHYGRVFAELEKSGIRINFMGIQGAPDWAIKQGKERAYDQTGDTVADDMRDVHGYGRRLGEKYGKYFAFFEHINEPDLDTVAVWDVASQFKAAAYGMREAAPHVTMLSPSFSRVGDNLAKIELFFENGTADYFDQFNFHIYNPIAAYPGLLGALRGSMGKFGLADRAIVLTETGTYAEGDGKIRSPYYPKAAEHTPEQELLQAEAMLKSQLYSQKLGVTVNFSFILTPSNQYHEGRKVWGFVRYDYGAKPALAAFANLSSNLAAARHLGVCDLGPDAVGHLFRQPDGSETLAVWVPTRIDTDKREFTAGVVEFDGHRRGHVELRQPDGEYRYRDAFGAPASLSAREGRLRVPVSRYPAYLHGVKGLKVVEPAPPVPVAAAPVDETLDPSIVFKIDFSRDFSIPTGRLPDHAVLNRASGRLLLDVNNLGGAEKTGRLRWSGGTVEGMPENLVLKPYERRTLSLVYTPRREPGTPMARLRFDGTFDGKRVSPLVAPVFPAGELEEAALPGTRDVARWRANAGGAMTIANDEKESGAIVFTVDFKRQPWWASPEFPLALPGESLAGAVGVAFDIQCDPAVNKAVSLYAVTDTTPRHGKSVQLPCSNIVTDGWEGKRAFFTRTDLAPGEIKMLRIAVAPQREHCTFRIRNVRLLRPATQ